MRIILPGAGVEYDDAEALVDINGPRREVEVTVGDKETGRCYTLNLSRTQAETLAAAIEGVASRLPEVEVRIEVEDKDKASIMVPITSAADLLKKRPDLG